MLDNIIREILEKQSWQLTTIILGIFAVFIFRSPIANFIGRIQKIGKDGISTNADRTPLEAAGVNNIAIPQTIEVIRLYQGYQYGKFLEMAFDLIDKFDEGKHYLFEQQYLVEQADSIRKESRAHLSIFETPYGNLGKFLDDNFPSDEFHNDINKMLDLIKSDKKPSEKRHLVVKYLTLRKSSLADKYRRNLKKSV